MASRDFDLVEEVKNDSKKLVLKFCLNGFKPSKSSHSCHATVSSDSEVNVEANMDGGKYLHVVTNVNAAGATCKPSKDTIEVHIKRA